MSTEAETMKAKGFLTAAEVAERIGKHVQTVYWWMKDGKIEHVWVSGHKYVSWPSVVRHYTEIDPKGASLLGIGAKP
jgi:excisionase family DNA binding protein